MSAEEPEIVPLPEPEREEVGAAVPLPDSEPGMRVEAEVAEEFDELEVDAPRVAIVVSEPEDLDAVGACETELTARGIRSESRVISADEEPRAVADYTENARMRGIRVIVAGAGPAARLAHMITVHTRLPVIGVPLTVRGAAGELEELLREPAAADEGPVAWVGLDDALAAAVLAARILGA